MKKRLTAAAMASILLLPAATMAEAQTGRAVAPENHSAPAVTQHHQQVNTGQLFTLTLPANPSTGYTWIFGGFTRQQTKIFHCQSPVTSDIKALHDKKFFIV